MPAPLRVLLLELRPTRTRGLREHLERAGVALIGPSDPGVVRAVVVDGDVPPNDGRRIPGIPLYLVAELPPDEERRLLADGVRVIPPARLETLAGAIARDPAGPEESGAVDLLRELVGQLDGVVYEMDGRSYEFTFVSPTAERLLGYPVDAWYQKGFWPGHVHPDDIARVDAFWLREAAAGRAHIFEYRMRARDGRIVWIQDRATPVDRPGGGRNFVGLMLDVTALKAAEETVQVVSDLTARHVGDAFCRALVVGLCRALDVRHAMVAEVSETEPGRFEAAGLAIDGSIAPATSFPIATDPGAPVLRGEVHHVADDLATRHPESRAVREWGAVSYLGYPLHGSTEHPIGVLCLLDGRPIERTNRVDTTMSVFAARAGAELERRRSERQRQSLQLQLVQAQKMEAIGTLAGGIAHDFNNILMGILGNAEIVAEELESWHPARVNLGEILRATQRAREVVQRVLTFSRQRQPERQPVLLGSIVEEAVGLLRSSLPSSIAIRVERAADSIQIEADPGQIHQVVMNLAANSAQALGGRQGNLIFSETTVDVDRAMADAFVQLREGRYVRLTVQDDGPGMSPETLGRIFEPFFTTKQPGEGTGLGLAVVHGIVQDHGGAIIVRSRIDEGTGFDIYFPALRATAGAAESGSPRPPAAGQRVLLVDDEPAIVRVGRRILERLGYRVTAEESPRTALDRFLEAPEQFDLVITDLTMPEFTGLEVAARVRAANPSVRVILMTGNIDLIDLARHAEIDEVLPKPFATSRLAHVVHRLIGPPEDRGGTTYFAYGANLDREHMARTAPAAVVLGRAILPDRMVTIGSAGYATLVPAGGEVVHGLLWYLTRDDERRLDEFERLPDGIYLKSTALVRTETGEEVEAMIYLASDPTPGTAPAEYIEHVIRAAERLEFPVAYRAALARLPSVRRSSWLRPSD